MDRIPFAFRRCVFILAAVLLGWVPGVGQAQTLYGITFLTDELITINTVTGAGTLVGPLSSSMAAVGLAFRGTKLYAIDGIAKRVQELDPATGLTLSTINIGALIGGEGDFTFRSDGIGFLADPRLTRFDITVPNSVPIAFPGPIIDGLAFNGADVLFALEQGGANFYSINLATAAPTLIGATGIPGGPYSTAGLAFDPSGNLFAAVGMQNGSGSFLYKIDPATGTATLIGSIGFDRVSGITFGPGGPPPPPAAGVSPSKLNVSVTEGGATDSYTVVLNTAPTMPVTITINPGTQVTVAPATLTFTPANWNVAQTVTVTAVDDALVEGAHIGTISHTSASADLAYNAIVIASVTANITDNDVGPLPPPPPTPGGGIAEGSYPGSMGLGNGNGGEGTFGFGRHLRQPFLKGPHRDPRGKFRVFNVAHQQPAKATAADSGLGVLGWGLIGLAILAPAVLVYGRRRSA